MGSLVLVILIMFFNCGTDKKCLPLPHLLSVPDLGFLKIGSYSSRSTTTITSDISCLLLVHVVADVTF